MHLLPFSEHVTAAACTLSSYGLPTLQLLFCATSRSLGSYCMLSLIQSCLCNKVLAPVEAEQVIIGPLRVPTRVSRMLVQQPLFENQPNCRSPCVCASKAGEL